MSDGIILTRKPRFDFTAETLPGHPIFNGLTLQSRQILAKCGMRTDFNAGDKVVAAGEPASGFYLVIQGSINLETVSERQTLRVQTIEEGDILGWSWLFPPFYWHFDALAQEPVRTIFFYGSRLRWQCDQNHDFGYELIKGMSQILLEHLKPDRERWIETAQIASQSPNPHSNYLVI
jgi:CRP-like cAMP-binding protein